MITFVRVHSIENQFGQWYARVVFSKDGVEFSEFIKIRKGATLPTQADVEAQVVKVLEVRNAPKVEPTDIMDLIPVDAPNFPSLTGLSAARVSAIWSDFVTWIKSWFRSRR